MTRKGVNRRRRCRRHVHRFVLVRRGGAGLPRRQGAVAARRRSGRLSARPAALGAIESFGAIVHGTTVGTNTLLERRGPRIGVITTRGFRDVLEMRRRDRRQTWGLWGEFVPIAARDLRFEVDERTLADGSIRTPVDEAAVMAAAKALHERGAQALAINFINAYANPRTSARARGRGEGLAQRAPVSLASGAPGNPRIRARLDDSAQRLFAAGGRRLYWQARRALAQQKFAGTFHIVQSNGGVMSTATARRLPVRTALSGPAAGVIAAAAIARASGFDNVITCDLGGTSFDVSVIAGAMPSLAAQTVVDFGLVIGTPMIEITTIGRWRLDRLGRPRWAPPSRAGKRGSVPGPACYGQGNERPT